MPSARPVWKPGNESTGLRVGCMIQVRKVLVLDGGGTQKGWALRMSWQSALRRELTIVHLHQYKMGTNQ